MDCNEKMTKENFEMYGKTYAPIIRELINSNVRFYGFEETIKWSFVWDEDGSIIAACNRETNLISVNLKSVMYHYINRDLETIEFYI